MLSFPGKGDLSGSDGAALQKRAVARKTDQGDANASSGQGESGQFRAMVEGFGDTQTKVKKQGHSEDGHCVDLFVGAPQRSDRAGRAGSAKADPQGTPDPAGAVSTDVGSDFAVADGVVSGARPDYISVPIVGQAGSAQTSGLVGTTQKAPPIGSPEGLRLVSGPLLPEGVAGQDPMRSMIRGRGGAVAQPAPSANRIDHPPSDQGGAEVGLSRGADRARPVIDAAPPVLRGSVPQGGVSPTQVQEAGPHSETPGFASVDLEGRTRGEAVPARPVLPLANPVEGWVPQGGVSPTQVQEAGPHSDTQGFASVEREGRTRGEAVPARPVPPIASAFEGGADPIRSGGDPGSKPAVSATPVSAIPTGGGPAPYSWHVEPLAEASKPAQPQVSLTQTATAPPIGAMVRYAALTADQFREFRMSAASPDGSDARGDGNPPTLSSGAIATVSVPVPGGSVIATSQAPPVTLPDRSGDNPARTRSSAVRETPAPAVAPAPPGFAGPRTSSTVGGPGMTVSQTGQIAGGDHGIAGLLSADSPPIAAELTDLGSVNSLPAGPQGLAANGAVPGAVTPSSVSIAGSVPQQIAQSFQSLTGSETIIRLEPEELGRVSLSLRGDERSLTLTISAERAETLDLIRRTIHDLAVELSDLGYADIAFEFGGSQERETGDGSDRARDPGRLDDDLPEATPNPAPAARIPGRGHVDIRI